MGVPASLFLCVILLSCIGSKYILLPPASSGGGMDRLWKGSFKEEIGMLCVFVFVGNKKVFFKAFLRKERSGGEVNKNHPIDDMGGELDIWDAWYWKNQAGFVNYVVDFWLVGGSNCPPGLRRDHQNSLRHSCTRAPWDLYVSKYKGSSVPSCIVRARALAFPLSLSHCYYCLLLVVASLLPPPLFVSRNFAPLTAPPRNLPQIIIFFFFSDTEESPHSLTKLVSHSLISMVDSPTHY